MNVKNTLIYICMLKFVILPLTETKTKQNLIVPPNTDQTSKVTVSWIYFLLINIVNDLIE